MTNTKTKLEEFDIRKVLPFTMGYAQRHPHEMESTVADKINAEVNFTIHQAKKEMYIKGFTDGFEHSDEGFNGGYTHRDVPENFLEIDAQEAFSSLKPLTAEETDV